MFRPLTQGATAKARIRTPTHPGYRRNGGASARSSVTRRTGRRLLANSLALSLGLASLAIVGGAPTAAQTRDARDTRDTPEVQQVLDTRAAADPAAASDTPDIGVGRVERAAALNVRTGPGAEHNSIGMLHRGDTVRIEAIVGKWARVHSADLSGYVNRAFIEIVDKGVQPLPTATTIPANRGDPTPPILAAANPGTAASSEAEAPIAHPDREMREEIRRILTLSEELHRDLEELDRAPAPAETSIAVQVGVGLLGLGGVIGFFVGTILGRRQERGGRSRVRF